MMPTVTLTGGHRLLFQWTKLAKPVNDRRLVRCHCGRTACSCSEAGRK